MTMATTGTTYDDLAETDYGTSGVSDTSYGMDKGSGSYGGGTGGVGEMVRKQTLGLREQATEKLRGVADEGKEKVVSSLDGLVTAAREIADKLQDGSFGPVGDYATQAADKLEGWTQSMRNKSVEELFDDGRELVRTQPAVAIGIAVAAGFALTRFLKASGGRTF